MKTFISWRDNVSISNTPPRRPVKDRSNADLLEDLDVSLRRVESFQMSELGVQLIAEVKEIYDELHAREFDLQEFFQSLNQATGWLMDQFLHQCLDYPRQMPEMKLLNGVRLRLSCIKCGQRERPEDDSTFWMCTSCINRALDAIHHKSGELGFMVFRTYSSYRRCSHADSETTLVALSEDHSWIGPWCERCLTDEVARRRS